MKNEQARFMDTIQSKHCRRVPEGGKAPAAPFPGRGQERPCSGERRSRNRRPPTGGAGVAGFCLTAFLLLSTAPAASAQPLAAGEPLLVAQNASSQDRRLANRLIRLNRLEDQLENAAAQFRLLTDELQEYGMPPRSAWLTRHVLKRAMNTRRFIRAFRNYLLERMDPDAAAQTVRWLRSPFGRQIIELESRKFTEHRIEEKRIFMDMLRVFPPPDRRRKLAAQVVDAWKYTEFSLEILEPIIRLWFPHRQKFFRESARSLVLKVKKELREPIRQERIRGALFQFQDLNTPELERLARFADSAPGRWYGEVFSRGMAYAFKRQFNRAEQYLEDLLERIESEEDGLELLKRSFPPGERYLALGRRDPFQPLVEEQEGLRPFRKPKPPAKGPESLREREEDLPVIPMELFKVVQEEDPQLYADLQAHAEIFNNPSKIEAMDEETYVTTLENYRGLIEQANRMRGKLVGTPLEKPYGELQFVGVIHKEKDSVALIETADGRGHIVKDGNMIGPNLGVVDEVEDGRIIVLERYRDYLGSVLTNTKEIAIGQSGQNSGEEMS